MTGKNVSHKVAMILPYWWMKNQAKHSVNGTDIHLYGGIFEFLEKIKATHEKEFSRVVIFEFGGTLPDYTNKYLTTDNYATDLYQGILSRGEHKIRSLRKRFFDEEDNPPYVVFEGFEEEDPIEQENQLRYISPNYKEHDERYKLLAKYYEEYANNYPKLETIYVAADNEKPEIFPDISSNLYWYLAELSGDEHMSRNTYYIPADHEEIDVQLIETLATGEYNAIAGLTSEDDYEISEKHIPNQREVDLDEFFTNIQDALEGDPEEDEDDNVQSPNFDSDWDDSGVNGTEVWGSDGGFESSDDEDFNDDDGNVHEESPQEDQGCSRREGHGGGVRRLLRCRRRLGERDRHPGGPQGEATQLSLRPGVSPRGAACRAAPSPQGKRAYTPLHRVRLTHHRRANPCEGCPAVPHLRGGPS